MTAMHKALSYFDVSPKIFLDGRETDVTIRPLGGPAFDPDAEYVLEFLPFDESREPAYDYDRIQVKPVDGCLKFTRAFTGEQEYYIRIFRSNKPAKPENAWLNFRVYALSHDLYDRFPWRGDLHAHSTASDGNETTEVVAANYRKAGFDFFAQTDHHRYQPSVRCEAYYSDKSVDLHILRGEEVHSPGNHVHIINAGGTASVNEMFEADPEGYDREVRALIQELAIPDGVNAYEYAACVWVFRKIRESGGLAIFAHPLWMADVYHVPLRLTDALFASNEFDAFELLGGHELHSNNLQTSYYFEARERGMKYPAVGSSDAHETVEAMWFTWMSTIAFAPKNDTASLLEAIRAGFCVAVEQYPGEEPRVYGAYRLVKFARFLLTEYFPLHDELCFEEGRLMRAMFLNEPGALESLERFRGRTRALLFKYYGKGGV